MSGNKTKSHCNECGGEKNHEIKASVKESGSEPFDEGYSLDWCTTWEIMKCLGCDELSAKKTFYFSENDGNEVTFYPAPVSKRKPEWLKGIKDKALLNLFAELYIVLQANAPISAVSICRAIIDRIIQIHVGDKGGFVTGIKALKNEGHIAEKELELINFVIEAGSAATHRGWKPENNTYLEVVTGIVENLVERLFVLPSTQKKLIRGIPKRKQIKKVQAKKP